MHHHGEVIWFNKAKGYGFPKYDTGRDVFCHFSALLMDGYKQLHEVQRGEFDLTPGVTGRDQAANVRVLSRYSQQN